jgi:hypothetical protein
MEGMSWPSPWDSGDCQSSVRVPAPGNRNHPQEPKAEPEPKVLSEAEMDDGGSG